MNAQFALAVAFGLGVAGLAFSVSLLPVPLASRIGQIKSPASSYPRPRLTQWLRVKGRLVGTSPRIQKALFELPELLDLLAVCLSAGDSIYRALGKVVPRASGEVAKELGRILKAVEFGAPLSQEIGKLPLSLPHPQFSELSSKISLSLTRGTPLARMLLDQAQSARSEIRNQLIRQAGKNETRMLIPLVFLILPVTVMFAIYPSLRLLNFNYF